MSSIICCKVDCTSVELVDDVSLLVDVSVEEVVSEAKEVRVLIDDVCVLQDDGDVE